jgi:hypothetical protein
MISRAVTDLRRPYLIAMSDGYCDPCVRQHFDVFARALRKGNAVLPSPTFRCMVNVWRGSYQPRFAWTKTMCGH